VKSKKEQDGYRPRVDEIDFDEKATEKMGLILENILCKDVSKITEREVDIIKYAKNVILFRKGLLGWENFQEKTEKIRQNEGKKNTLALSLWIRGARSSKKELLSLEELEELDERVEEKLSKINDASFLHS